MFPFWIVLGTLTILVGIFNKQMMRRLGFRPVSEVITSLNLKNSTRHVEQIGRWLMITLGIGFLALGLGETLPDDLSYKISSLFVVLSGLMLLGITVITLTNWKAK